MRLNHDWRIEDHTQPPKDKNDWKLNMHGVYLMHRTTNYKGADMETSHTYPLTVTRTIDHKASDRPLQRRAKLGWIRLPSLASISAFLLLIPTWIVSATFFKPIVSRIIELRSNVGRKKPIALLLIQFIFWAITIFALSTIMFDQNTDAMRPAAQSQTCNQSI